MKHKRKKIVRKMMAVVLASATALSVVPVSSVMAEDQNIAQVNGAKYSTVKDAWEAVRTGGTLELLKDWDTKSYGRLYVNENATVTINMNGHSINRHIASDGYKNSVGDGEVFFVEKNAVLTINGGSSDITHNGRISNGVWYEDANATSMPIKGGVIVGGNSTNGAGGIHIKKGANVNLNNVTLAGNMADDKYGGGVRMKGENSNLTLNNSHIIYNAAEGYGGGVYIDSENCTVNLKNSSSISYNTATKDDGGGIYTNEEYTTIKMSDDSEISHNTAKGKGGGIYSNDQKTTVKMDDDSEISDNTANGKGGGIYFNYSKVVVKGGAFRNNRSNGGGGGAIYLEHYRNRFSTDSGVLANITFENNYGAGDGGAIHSEQEYVSVESCTITNNRAKDHGGGIYIYNDDNSISSCTITGNSANKGGGGVYTDSTETVALGGKLIIKDNTANNKTNNYEMKKTISSSPSSGSQVGITADLGVIGEIGHYAQNVFFSDVDGRHVEWNDKDRKLYLKEGNKDTKVDSVSTGVKEVTKEGNKVLKGTFSYPSLEETIKDLDGTFYYTDAYFKNPGTYNEHLATMSLCMAMSAFNSNVGNDNKDGTDYVLKSKNIVKLLSDIGVGRDNIYLSNTYTVKPGTGTIGVAIGQKELDDEGHILVPIAVRGAGYESEWTSNVTIGNNTEAGEHAGFADAANQVFAQVKSYISNYNLEQAVREGKVKFWVTGYSRAGATANLTARRLIDAYGTNNEVYAYCMEAPQGALKDYTTGKSQYNIIHNCINYNDPVPKVAPSFMNFIRYGEDKIFNKPNTDTSAMKTQLHAVAPDLAYDDYYVIGTINLFMATVDSYLSGKNPNMIIGVPDIYVKKAAPTNTGQFTDELISKLKEWAINDRSAFTEVNKDIDLRDNTSLEKVSFEKSLQLVMPIVFSKSDKELDELIEVASERANDLSMYSIYNGPILGKWQKQNPETKKKWIWDELWYKVVETKDGNGISTKLTSKELTDLKTAWPTLLDTVFTFVSNDYNYTGWVNAWALPGSYDAVSGGLNVLGTLIYNSSSLMQAHYPEINYAWLRSMDTYYSSDTIPVKLQSTEEPKITYSLKDTTYDGDQTLKLSTTESTKGAGIYYRLTTTVNGTATTTSWLPYNNGITLPVGTKADGTQCSATYKVETRSVYHTTECNATKEYTVNPVHRYSVNVLMKLENSSSTMQRKSYDYNAGEKVTINASDIENYFFIWWGFDNNELKDKATLSEDKKTVTFTMPERDVTLYGTYRKLINEFWIDQLEVPKGNTELDTKVRVFFGKAELQGEYDLNWTLVNDNNEHEIVTAKNADFNKTYEAVVVVRPEERKYEFAKTITKVEVNDIDLPVPKVERQKDGSLWIYCGEMTTGNPKFVSVDPVQVNAKTGTEISNLGLPQNVKITTEAGAKNVPVDEWKCENYKANEAGTYTFTADINSQTAAVDPKDGETKITVTAEVTLTEKAKASEPAITADSVLPGRYKGNQTIHLETFTDNATIMYRINDGEEKSYDSDGIKLNVPKDAVSGKETSYTITAYTKSPDSGEMDNSNSVEYTYTIVEPYKVTISYADTGFEGSKWSKEPTTTTYLPGETAYIIAQEENDEQFAQWKTDGNSGITISDEEATSKLIKVDSINKDINLTAVYNPIVKKINLTIQKPETGEKLAKTVSACSATITKEYDVLNDFKKTIPITWTPEGNDGTASAYQSYTAKMSMSMDNEKAKFFVSDQLELTIKDVESQSWSIEQKDGKDVLVVYATFAPTAKVKAVSVVQPDSAQVGYGASNDEIFNKLAKKVQVNLADGTTTEADVNWTEVAGYNTSILAEQKITATGTITLPEYVDGSGINTNITADVYVAGAERVKTPTASVDSGIYNNAVSVTLSTDTEGATIYYTTDGSEPATSVTERTQMYNGTPITMDGEVSTLNAIAVKENMQDSSTLSCTYYIHRHVDNNGDGKCDGINTGKVDENNNPILENCDTVLLGRSNDAEETAASVPGTIVQDDGKGTIYVKVNGEDIVEKVDDKNDVEGTTDASSSEAEDTKKETEQNWKYSNDVYPTTKLTYDYKPEGSDDSVATTPHKYIFAGWYNAEDKEVKDADGNTTAETVMEVYDKMPTETAYAKFVDATVLSVKAQIKAGTTKTSEKTNMRFIATVDNLKYDEVGFEIAYGEKKVLHASKTVNNKIYAADENKYYENTPTSVCKNNISQYFMTFRINDIPNSSFDEEYKVRAYWITEDGTKVYGDYAIKKVNMSPDFNKN